MGVRMFFVISGFCVMCSLKNSLQSQESPSSFLLRRLKRVYIPFWFSVALVAALPFLTQMINSFDSGVYVSPRDIKLWYHGYLKFSLLDWIETFTLLRIFEDPGNARWLPDKFSSINGVYWSLAIEVQFYLVMFVALLLKNKINIILLLITILSLFVSTFLPGYILSGVFLYYWHYFALGIMINILFSYQIKPSSFPSLKNIFKISTVIVFVSLITLLLTNNHLSPSIFTTLFLLFVWLVEIHDSRYLRCLSNNNIFCFVLSFLGLFSYSIYLIHVKLYYFVENCLRQIVPVHGAIALLFNVLATLMGCYLFHLLCEKPFYKRKL